MMDFSIMAIPFLLLVVGWTGWFVYKYLLPEWRERQRQKAVLERGRRVRAK